jgi:CheY-like chemotaxis protein
MLSSRQGAILKSIAEQYITKARPVPSQSIVNDPGLGISSATIRNEVAHLEEEGYEVETAQSGKEAFEKYGYLMDPHSAVGFSVWRRYREEAGDGSPVLLASTASPFKFNRAVLEALGRDPARKNEFSLLEELSYDVVSPRTNIHQSFYISERLPDVNLLPI